MRLGWLESLWRSLFIRNVSREDRVAQVPSFLSASVEEIDTGVSPGSTRSSCLHECLVDVTLLLLPFIHIAPRISSYIQCSQTKIHLIRLLPIQIIFYPLNELLKLQIENFKVLPCKKKCHVYSVFLEGWKAVEHRCQLKDSASDS